MNELSLFNSLFDNDFGFGTFALPQVSQRKCFGLPSVDVKESENAYTLDMDLPGRSDEDVSLDLKDNVLTIASAKEEKTAEKKPEANNDTFLIKERYSTAFSRSFTLPEDVDKENISAAFKNGVLSITMPKSKQANMSKHIAITAA